MLFNLLLETATGGGSTEPTKNPVMTYVIFGVLLVAIVGLFIWQSFSSKKKQKEAQNMVDSLKKGDRVKTIGGICGFVHEINNEENTFVLETGSEDNKSYVKFDKGAIYQTAPKEGAAVAAEKAKEEEKKEEAAEEKPVKKSKKAKKTAEVKEEAVEEEKQEEVKTEEPATPEVEQATTEQTAE